MKRKIALGIMLTLLILGLLAANMTIVTAQETHDIAVVSVTPSSTLVEKGNVVNITVVVENQGHFSETFNLNCTYDDTLISTQTNITLTSGESRNITFSWKVTFDPAFDFSSPFKIKAAASNVPGETDTEDNTLTSSSRIRVFAPPYVAVVPHSTVNSSLTIGTNYTVSIYTDYSGSDITAYEFSLTWNPNVLAGVSVANDGIMSDAAYVLGTFNNTAGSLSTTYAYFVLAGWVTSGPGKLATVTFNIVGWGDSDITLGDNTLLIGWDPVAELTYKIISEYRPSWFHILHGYFSNLPVVEVGWIEGAVTNASSGDPIEGATVSANGVSNVTDASGSYSLAVFAGTYNVTATMTCYENQTVTDVSVSADETVTQDFALIPIVEVFYWTLTVDSDPISGIDFTVDGAAQTTPYSDSLVEGSHDVVMPATWPDGADVYNFDQWEDGSLNPSRTVSLMNNTVLTAYYTLPPVPEYPVVYVDPMSTINETLTPSINYTASIMTNYTGDDITSYQFTLTYNPYVLHITSVANGDVVFDSPVTAFMVGPIDNVAGTLNKTGAFFWNPGGVASGPGTLATVTFEVVGIGKSNITLGSAVQLNGWNASGVPSPHAYFIVNGRTMPDHLGHGFFNNVQPIHDVAVVQLKVPATTFTGQVPIQVIVANEGNYTESVTVRVSYNTSEIGTESFTLASGLFKTIFLSWNTTDLTEDIYSITAEAILDGDDDPIDNSATTTVIVSGTLLSVPYHYQITSYYCGPASLEMVFDYYGPDISQREIADAAMTSRGGTGSMVRPAHFSNLSTSKGDEMPGNVTGYTARKLGYAAFYASWPFTLDELKSLIDAGYPIIVGTLFSEEEPIGHYRVVVGQNATHVILHDPWFSIGPMLSLTNSEFLDLWFYDGLFVSSWEVSVSAPQNVREGDTFTVTATVTYPCPTSFSAFEYPASMTNATIILPEGMSLDLGDSAKKLLGTGNMPAGNSVVISWKVKADSSGDYKIGIEAAGKVSGWFGGDSYEDRIGGLGNVNVTANPRPTTIASVSICPTRLNLRSVGRWITAYIELPEDYNVEDIDVFTIMLNDAVPAESSKVCGRKLMVRFDRSEVIALLPKIGEAELTITGTLFDGTPFEGSDTIRVK